MIEKELLSIVETLKAFCSALFGAIIHVYTDHCNLTHKLSQFLTQRVLRWRLLLAEFGPTSHCKPGPQNVVADALSHVPSSRVVRENPDDRKSSSDAETHCMFENNPNIANCLCHDVEVADCHLEHPVFDEEGQLPTQFETLAECQACSDELTNLPEVFPGRFSLQAFRDVELMCFHQNGEDKIVLATSELPPKVVKCSHESMAHAEGATRLANTIKRHFYR